MIVFLRRNVSWLILAVGTVGLPHYSLSNQEVTWVNMGDPYGTCDIAGSVVDSIDPVVAGSGPGNLTYTVTVTNLGPDSTDQAVAIVEFGALPAGVTIDSVTPSAGSWFGSQWTIGILAAGSSATLAVVMTVDASTPTSETLYCDVFATSLASDPNTSNNQAIEYTEIVGPDEAIFSDGFESGDISEWSAGVPSFYDGFESGDTSEWSKGVP